MQKIDIIGNITRDPETRTVNTSSGAVTVCDFTVAAQNRRDDDALFIRCTAWRGLADVVGQYCHKGSKVHVRGPLSVRTYEDKNNATKVSLEIKQIDEFENLTPKGASSDGQDPKFTPVTEEVPF